ncbi:hypothetical protein LTR95_009822 [Oleoguttula sp. CCFEE 5521]
MRTLPIPTVLITATVAVPTFQTTDHDPPKNYSSLLTRDRVKKPLLDGTAWLYHDPIIDTPKMRGQGLGKHWNQYPAVNISCFSNIDKSDQWSGSHCWSIEGHCLISAVNQFCDAIEGLLLDVTQQITSYNMTFDYWPASKDPKGERGSIFMQVGFADGGPKDPPKYTMDYGFCRGGYANNANTLHGNDRLFWVLDPNPIVQHPYSNDLNKCNNKQYYWLPWSANIQGMGYVFDQCRHRWNEDTSPADAKINPKNCWDCYDYGDGCTKADWDAIDGVKLSGEVVVNGQFPARTPAPTLTPTPTHAAGGGTGVGGSTADGIGTSIETAVSLTNVPAIAPGDGGIGDAIATMGPPPPKPSS